MTMPRVAQIEWLFWIAVAYVVAYAFYVVIDWYVCLCRNSRSAAREAALSVSHFSPAPATTSASGSNGGLVVSVMASPAGVVPSQSGDSGQLLPFSRAERGYYFSFAQKQKGKVH